VTQVRQDSRVTVGEDVLAYAGPTFECVNTAEAGSRACQLKTKDKASHMQLYKPLELSVADPHHLDADPDPAFHFDADPDPDPAFSQDVKKSNFF